MVESQPIEDVPVQLIHEIDTTYWYQHEDVPTIRRVAEHFRLMMEADLAYPIILDPQGRVMDGMHRVARALAEGRTTIRARRLSRMPPPDFRDCQPADLPYWPAEPRPLPSRAPVGVDMPVILWDIPDADSEAGSPA